MVPTGKEDIEVNIIESSEVSNNGQDQSRCEDTFESTSSFGDTFSGGEMELVESQLLSDDWGSEFRMRRKKVTNHWRRFIRPLKWRCKWLELQIKNLKSQSLKYDGELAKHEDRKLSEFYTNLERGFDAKIIPFYSSSQRKKAMKRKKRKRIEEMTDIIPYMMQHNVFSYYENWRSSVNFGSVKGDSNKAINASDKFGLDDDESKDDDKIRENLLGKIEVLQSQIRKLKARIEKVVSENPGKFSSVNMLSSPAPSDQFTNSDQNPYTETDPYPPYVESGDGILIDNERAKDEIKDSFLF